MQNFDKPRKAGLGRGLGSLLGGDLDNISIEPSLTNGLRNNSVNTSSVSSPSVTPTSINKPATSTQSAVQTPATSTVSTSALASTPKATPAVSPTSVATTAQDQATTNTPKPTASVSPLAATTTTSARATIISKPAPTGQTSTSAPTSNPVVQKAAVITPAATIIAQPAETVPRDARIWKIPIEKIAPNIDQPRRTFEKEKLQELAQSLKNHGVIQPITVRKKGDQFELIAGERRWRAAQLAGLSEIPAIIKDFSEQQSLEVALIENIQRADLNPIEEAEAYELLMDRYRLTQQEVADKVGKDRATVANICRLNTLQKDVKELVKTGEISMGHAKVLLGVFDQKAQKKLALKVAKQKQSVRQLEKMVKTLNDLGGDAESIDEGVEIDVSQKLVQAMSEDLQKKLGTKVSIDYANQKGKITIHFYSDEELTSITDRMKKAWNQQT